jgi:hypothetical protein
MGFRPENRCRYNVVKCCREKGIKNCGECNDDEYLMLKKAFFEKEKNLDEVRNKKA